MQVGDYIEYDSTPYRGVYFIKGQITGESKDKTCWIVEAEPEEGRNGNTFYIPKDRLKTNKEC